MTKNSSTENGGRGIHWPTVCAAIIIIGCISIAVWSYVRTAQAEYESEQAFQTYRHNTTRLHKEMYVAHGNDELRLKTGKTVTYTASILGGQGLRLVTIEDEKPVLHKLEVPHQHGQVYYGDVDLNPIGVTQVLHVLESTSEDMEYAVSTQVTPRK